MARLLASLGKELKLLHRDRAGLALLFVMPMVLVLVISLIQNNVLDTQSQVDVLLANADSGELGQALEDGLDHVEFFKVRTDLDGVALTADRLRSAVADGVCKVGIIIDAGASDLLTAQVAKLIDGERPDEDAGSPVAVVLDPTVPTALQSAIQSSVERLVQGEQVRVLLERLIDELQIDLAEDDSTRALGKSLQLGQARLTGIRQEFSVEGPAALKPNVVQHNVPAWTLFGIFFIAVPVSSSLLRERQTGTLARLFTIPVPFSTLLLGKILAYMLINLLQLGLMLAVGVLVLPLFGTPALELGGRLDLILAVGICASLAATGLGLMLGTVARTYEQASTVGPISIIIAAALGGIMVPVFLMPRFMQPVSAFSPLQWGHEAFLDIFVRGAGLEAVGPNMVRLLAFFAGTMAVSLVMLFRED